MHPGEETMLCYTEAWEIEGACFNRAVCNIGIIMAIKFSENYYQKHRILAFKTVDIKEPIHIVVYLNDENIKPPVAHKILHNNGYFKRND